MVKPKVIVLRSDGTNCDRETKFAFDKVGADASIVHMNSLIKGKDPILQRTENLDDYDILVIPGGFSYGDYIASGKVFTEYLKLYFGEQLARFIEAQKPVIGICNGFQILVKGGFLGSDQSLDVKNLQQRVSLTYNESNSFRDDWVKLVQPPHYPSKCIWTRGIETIDLPMAHGEGNFKAPSDLLLRLFDNRQIVFQYSNEHGNPTMDFPDNPNGSDRAVAGICDVHGTVFGLMPHPERYHDPLNHRYAIKQRLEGKLPDHGLGLDIFRNAVEYCRG